MTSELHVSATDLEAGLPGIEQAPASEGTIELIVRRPAEGERRSSRKERSTSTRAWSATAGARTPGRAGGCGHE
jgi:hypothetical protein